MKNILKTFALSLMLTLSFAVAYAGGSNEKKVSSKAEAAKTEAKAEVRNEIHKLININRATDADLDGEAVITFQVDKNEMVHVKGVFGTNDALINHLEYSLDGAYIDASNAIEGENYTLRVRFTDFN